MSKLIRMVVQGSSVLVLILGFSVESLHARIPRGFIIREGSSRLLAFSYVPVIFQWDTVEYDGGRSIRPSIDGAHVRTNENGSLVQWIVNVDLIVPGPGLFRLDRQDVRTIGLAQSLPFAVQRRDDGVRMTSASPFADLLTLVYDGIAGDRHVARVSIVVASYQNGKTTITRSADVSIVFEGAGISTTTKPSILDVLNPKAAWVDRQPLRMAKGEELQSIETFDNVFQMSIDREGIYRLTSDQLKNAGLPTDAQAARTIRVFGRGGLELPEHVDSARANTLREQAITVRTNDNGSVRDVIFYAGGSTGWHKDGKTIEHFIHHYSASAAYYLTYGGADGLRASVRASTTNEPTVRPALVTGRVFHEDELQSPYSSGSGRRWFGRNVENAASLTVNTILPGLVRNGTVGYRYVTAHRGNSTGTMTITENGTFVGQSAIRAVPKYMDAYSTFGTASVSAQSLPSDNRSVLKLAYSCPDRASNGILDWFEIHYPRQLNADAGEFEYWSVDGAGVHEYAVNGFSGDMFGVDVTDRTRPVFVENASRTGGMFVVREAIDSSIQRRYFLSSNLRQTTLAHIRYPNLHAQAGGASLIVITHPSLKESAERFAAYRSKASSIPVRVITTDDIYAEFSYGIQDPTAMRDFLAMAYAQWSPRPSAVLLWGDGHFDYKNISTSQINHLIPYESLDPDDEDYGLVTYTTDDYFVRLVGTDKRSELTLGRIPVTSNKAGDRFTEKIRNYESNASLDDWRTRITLIADDGQQEDGRSDGDLHLDQNEVLAKSYIPKDFQIRKIYMVEYPTENVARGRRKPTVTQDMLSHINTTGSIILNWIGHGNPRVLAHEQIFIRETTPPLMSNVSKPFLLTAATCDFARWDMTELQSGAEELLLLDNGGAIGIFSAARVVFSYANAAINEEFYSDLFTREVNGSFPTVGEVMYRVKQKYHGNNDEKFHLLADPTMRILIPEQRVRFSKINGLPITSAGLQVTVPALGAVTVEGDVIGTVDSLTDASFEGNVTISLLDASRTVTVIDNDVYNSPNTFDKLGPALYRGSFSVTNGKFVATFVVPKDISFSSQAAGLYGYAASKDRRFAMGITDRVVVDGVTSVINPETQGPDIKIFMDSRKFLPGGIARSNPILIVDLEDATGINTTGVGIGHDISATFDTGLIAEILTPSFTTSLENSRAGTAQKQIFGLTPGLHSVLVQAWDVYNNVSEASTTFRIEVPTDGIPAEGLFNFPNPFSDRTTIRFTHASPRPFDATLLIYDLHGRLITERPMRISDMQTADVSWEGDDNAGIQLGTGMYQAVVRLMDQYGVITFVHGKLVLIR